MNYGFLILILIINYGSDLRVLGLGPTEMVGSRMTLACGAQPTFQAAKIFDDCLTDHGLDYRFLDVCKPCGKVAGLDMSTYKGVWEFSCLLQGINREKTFECIVDQMKKQVPKMDIISLSAKAMEKCKECVEKLMKNNVKNKANETKKKAQEEPKKKAQEEAKKKAQEEAKKKKGGGGGGGSGGGGGGGSGGGGGKDGSGKDGSDKDGEGGGKGKRKGGIFGPKKRNTTAKPRTEQQTQQQKKIKQQQMKKAPAKTTKLNQ